MSRWYDRIIAAHTAVTDQVSHHDHIEGDRYFVWQEEGRADYIADGVHAEKVVTGSTDLYTRIEFDPWADEIEDAFDADGAIEWEKTVAGSKETQTGLIHHEWTWSVKDGKDRV